MYTSIIITSQIFLHLSLQLYFYSLPLHSSFYSYHFRSLLTIASLVLLQKSIPAQLFTPEHCNSSNKWLIDYSPLREQACPNSYPCCLQYVLGGWTLLTVRASRPCNCLVPTALAIGLYKQAIYKSILPHTPSHLNFVIENDNVRLSLLIWSLRWN